VVCACVGGASAGAPNYRYAVNARDIALAKRIATISGDLPALGWKGGATKPDRSSDSSTCKGQPPEDLHGLTVTGDAATRYELPGTVLYVQVQLLARPAMADADWQRNRPRSGTLGCYGREVVRTVHQRGARLVRDRLLPIPPLGDHRYAVRAVVTWAGAAHPVLFDVISVSSGRAEYSIVMAGPDAGRADEAGTLGVELRVALGLEARVLDQVTSTQSGSAPRIEGAFRTTDREVAVVHTFGLGTRSSQTWNFAPGCAVGGCVTTMSHPSRDHPGTTFRATLRPAGMETYRGRWQSHSDCVIAYPDGRKSVLPNQWLVQEYMTLHVTTGPGGSTTGYTGTRLTRSTPLAGARAHGCTITGYQLDEVHGSS